MLPPNAAQAGGKAHAIRFLSRQGGRQMVRRTSWLLENTSPLVGEVGVAERRREGGRLLCETRHPPSPSLPQVHVGCFRFGPIINGRTREHPSSAGGGSRLRLAKPRPSPPRRGFADSPACARASRSLRMQRMTAAEATVASLIAHGLDTVYALPG